MAAPICANHIDKGMQVVGRENLGINFGSIVIPPLLYQDDILIASISHKRMQEMVTIAEEFQKKNLLNFNLDKSEQMVMQYSKNKQIEKENLILNGQVIKQVESYKYLGDLKNTKGTLDLCISKRINAAMGVIHEIKFLTKQEAFKKQSFEISIKLIEAILMPKVLYACETWTNLTKMQINSLEKLQKDAVTIINSLPQSMPYDGIVFECGLLPMEFRVKEKRLIYFHKILNMSESRLTKIVYEEQKRLNFPNCWYKEVTSDLKMIDINLKECQIRDLTKEQWKQIVREK